MFGSLNQALYISSVAHLHSEPAVGLQHFVLSLVVGVFQPLLQHLDETAGVDVICRADEPQNCGGMIGKSKIRDSRKQRDRKKTITTL